MNTGKKILSIVLLSTVLIGLFFSQAYGEVQLSGEHRLVVTDETDGGFSSTVEITIQNSGATSLESLNLHLAPLDMDYLKIPQPPILELNLLQANSTTVIQWTVVSFEPFQHFLQSMPLRFLGSAQDIDGKSVSVSLSSRLTDIP